MQVLDLFSGIGGFSLGLERAGMKTVAFCEIDPFCRRVLAKHWPEVPLLGDIKEVQEFPAADVICGGFPCQDISRAGLRAGLSGSHSGLWQEMVRAIRLVRPRYAIMENVAELLGGGMGEVLGTLASISYDAEWYCVPAHTAGALHFRDRIWIVAYPHGQRQLEPGWGITDQRRWPSDRSEAIDWILAGSGVLRDCDAIPARLDRITPLGNAVVPTIPEGIGRAINGSCKS